MAILTHNVAKWLQSAHRRIPFPRIPNHLILVIGVCYALMVSQVANGATSRDFQVKAAFIYNFAQFTEWPSEAFDSRTSPLVIGVLGRDPFGEALDETVSKENLKGHPFKVERYSKLEEIKKCHILYIGQSEARNLDRILQAFEKKPVLTVSDIEGSAVRGVIIRFLTERNKIRFRINLEASRASGLVLSSKLLRAAEIVGPETK